VNFLRRLALQERKKNLDDSSRLSVVEIARVACFLSASVTRKDLQFGT
jgi:hypothetical protein